MILGCENFLKNKNLHQELQKDKIAFLGNSASVSNHLRNSFELIASLSSLQVTCIFSPQHGWHGVEQANMIPSRDSNLYGLPLFSLYKNESRELKPEHFEHFDTLIVDLQDVGCRIYTYLTTLISVLESCSKKKKSVIVFDRPNPVGRSIEGSYLHSSFKSMVGAWFLPMRYGMTLGEIARAYVQMENLDINLKVIPMENYIPNKEGEWGWPSTQSWVLPSPNMTDVECARCYSGTVLLEGTKISEGRGTATPLKVFGFPSMDAERILKQMSELNESWMQGCVATTCLFKPTFDKFKNEVCTGIRIYADASHYKPNQFKPYRWICLFLKSLLKIHPDWDWKLPPPYEYEYEKWPIDILSGDDFLRNWIEDSSSTVSDLEEKLSKDEKDWQMKSQPFYLYK